MLNRLQDLEVGVRLADRCVSVFLNRCFAVPCSQLRLAFYDCPVNFLHPTVCKVLVERLGDFTIDAKEQYPSGRPIDPVNVVDPNANLISKDLHGDQVSSLWLLSRMDDVPGWLVNDHKTFVLKKNFHRGVFNGQPYLARLR